MHIVKFHYCLDWICILLCFSMPLTALWCFINAKTSKARFLVCLLFISCALQEGDLKYTLYGVLVHYGWSTHSGHYYSYSSLIFIDSFFCVNTETFAYNVTYVNHKTHLSLILFILLFLCHYYASIFFILHFLLSIRFTSTSISLFCLTLHIGHTTFEQ